MAYEKQVWQNEVLSGVSADQALFTIKNSSGTIINDDVIIELKSTEEQAGTEFTADRMNHIEDGIEANSAAFDASTGHDHDGTNSKQIAAENVDGLSDYFNASTGHDHDGTDSKKIAYADITDTPLKATGAEINTGTEDTKIVTPKAIADSKLADFIRGDGWISANETWAYDSASKITVPSGAAAKYAIGDRIRWKQGAGYKYGVLVAVADTVLTIAVNTDYTVANDTITDNYYSHQASPIGYPQTFSYTPSYSANGSMTFGTVTTDTAKFSILGNVCSLVIFADGTTGGSASNELRVSLPVTTTNNTYVAVGAGWVLDGGMAIGGMVYITTSTTLAVIRYDGTNWGLGAGRRISFSATFRI